MEKLQEVQGNLKREESKAIALQFDNEVRIYVYVWPVYSTTSLLPSFLPPPPPPPPHSPLERNS